LTHHFRDLSPQSAAAIAFRPEARKNTMEEECDGGELLISMTARNQGGVKEGARTRDAPQRYATRDPLFPTRSPPSLH
jgi:hypothetical protein